MKRIITTAIMAMLLSVGIASAQENIKINSIGTASAQSKPYIDDVIYVIDHQVVASSLFDGSQLTNKTIANYQVDTEMGLHIIFTSDYTNDKKIYQTKVVTKGDGVSVVSYDSKGNAVASTDVVTQPETIYVVDGNVISADEFMGIFPSQIKSMTIIKSKDNPDFKKYSKSNTELVIMIVTKK